jgi:tetratricopeptide (TPR) repeat protein
VRSAPTALAVALAVTAVARAADPPPSPQADEAIALCERSREPGDPDEQRRLRERGLALAEQAVAADDHDPRAHFAVFCNVGSEMQAAGLSPRNLVAVRRLRREIDRTVALAPHWSDALFAKGRLLLELPRVMGGDAAEGERLLREALRIDPDYVNARLHLAQALAARGAHAEAQAEPRRALASAERKGDHDGAAEARKLLETP